MGSDHNSWDDLSNIHKAPVYMGGNLGWYGGFHWSLVIFLPWSPVIYKWSKQSQFKARGDRGRLDSLTSASWLKNPLPADRLAVPMWEWVEKYSTISMDLPQDMAIVEDGE